MKKFFATYSLSLRPFSTTLRYSKSRKQWIVDIDILYFRISKTGKRGFSLLSYTKNTVSESLFILGFCIINNGAK